MDDNGFAQSRGDDDLFDDELIPIDSTEVQTVTQQLQDTSIAPDAAQGPTEARPSSRGARGGPRGSYTRGAGRAGGGRGRGTAAPAQQSAVAPPSTDAVDGAETPVTSEVKEDAAGEDKVEQPSTETPRPQAVRGDRTATGGVKKPKLTEEELTAKMTEAKARATALSEAHARAQADAASFEERERVVQEKRKQVAARDAVNRRVMNDDREANRRRKMQAQGIREWDAEKNEEDFSTRGRGGRGGGFMRGAHGGARYEKRPEEDQSPPDADYYQEDVYMWEGRGRGRGRGSRGRGGPGRGRGGNGPNGRGGLSGSKYAQPDFNTDSEFPALPPGMKPKEEPVKQQERPIQTGRKVSEGFGSSGDQGSWAEQVESSVEAT